MESGYLEGWGKGVSTVQRASRTRTRTNTPELDAPSLVMRATRGSKLHLMSATRRLPGFFVFFVCCIVYVMGNDVRG